MMNKANNFVFVHGGGQAGWIWQELINALMQQSDGVDNALALDIPGCGQKRSRETGTLCSEDIADELIADIESAGLRDVVLVGHSMAGTILPYILDRRPTLLQRLVYITCSIPLPGQTVVQMMGGGLHGSNEKEVGWPADPGTTSMRERTRIMLCNDMDDAATNALMSRLGGDRWPTCTTSETQWSFKHLNAVPATYVVCLKDNVLPVHWQRIFAQRFQARRVVEIDAGHQVMNTRPERLAELLREEASFQN